MKNYLVEILTPYAPLCAKFATVIFNISSALLGTIAGVALLYFIFKAGQALVESCKFEFKSNPVFASILLLTGLFCSSGLVVLVAESMQQ